MPSRTTRRFWRWFSGLPAEVQQEAKRAYRLFQDNPAHPGLQFKKLEGEEDMYSVRIGPEYRALAVRRRDRDMGCVQYSLEFDEERFPLADAVNDFQKITMFVNGNTI